MDLENFKKLIPAFLDEDLQVSEKEEFMSFLEDHPEMQAEIDAYQKSWDILGEVETIEPSPNYMSRFWTTVSEQKPWYENLLLGLTSKRLVPALATVCVVVIVGLFAVRQFYQPDAMLANLNSDELEMVEYMELAENYEIIEDMELLEDFEVIEAMEMPWQQGKQNLWMRKNTSLS